MPRGGRRPGAGRKPRTALEKVITGNPGRRGPVLVHSVDGAEPVTAPIVPVATPLDLVVEEQKVWDALAPHATALRTLTPATEWSFRMLCRNVVLEETLAKSEQRGGPNHRGILQRVDAELLRFNLSPCGKPIYEAEPEAKPANPLAKFLRRG